MSDPNVISLNADVPAICAIVGTDTEAFGLLITLAQAGEIPCMPTRSGGGFLLSRRHLPLITRIFNDFRSK